MAATVIDGKAFAADVRGQVEEHVTRLKTDHGLHRVWLWFWWVQTLRLRFMSRQSTNRLLKLE